jgi:hypothetical protein
LFHKEERDVRKRSAAFVRGRKNGLYAPIPCSFREAGIYEEGGGYLPVYPWIGKVRRCRDFYDVMGGFLYFRPLETHCGLFVLIAEQAASRGA